VREADNFTTFMCRMSWNSGSLNLLEHSGTPRACYRTALHLLSFNYTFTLTWYLLNLSAIIKRRIWCDKDFIRSDSLLAVVIVHANCVLNSTLHPVEAVSFNYY